MYYFLPQGASSTERSLSVPGMLMAPIGRFTFACTATGRQVVCFANPENDPANSYADTLRRVTVESKEEPSQTAKVGRLAKLIVASGDETPWTLSDNTECRPFLRVHVVLQITELATRVRLAKNFGDESRLLQAHPHVPLQFQCPDSQQ